MSRKENTTTLRMSNVVITLCIDTAELTETNVLRDPEQYLQQYNWIGQLSKVPYPIHKAGDGSNLGIRYASGAIDENEDFPPQHPHLVAVKGNRMLHWRARAVAKPANGFDRDTPPASEGWSAQFKCLGYRANEDFYKQFTLIDDWRANRDSFFLLANRFKGSYDLILNLCFALVLTDPEGQQHSVVWDPQIRVAAEDAFSTLH